MGQARESGLWMPLRLVLVAVCFLLLVAADQRLQVWLTRITVTFESDMGAWFTFVFLAVLAGFAAGLAAVLPSRFSYRLGRVITLGILPLAVLAVMASWLPGGIPSGLPLWVVRFLFVGSGQMAVALLLGLAVAAGFAGPHERPAATPPPPPPGLSS